MYLYRPIGLFEYQLIEKSHFKKFPPRLYWQPIFYPVLNQKYAEKIALDWNTKDQASGYVGYVTRFELNDAYLAQFEVHVVGDDFCQELWIPAERLDEFNQQIIGQIEVVKIFKGDLFDENAQLPELFKNSPDGASEY
ncbi:ADP-ribosylation/crystallin J1 [Acinetobacter sp. C26M]|uniref:ADP-ribosylation/crystallin J1 n=1 Tax=unclassified Acinetobacter TaxID=196816 RepID=UPI002036D07C|nr:MULTISPECIES: ADP-ribosylation/crystallin J1 [unclassified Acinetobacter]USA46024.1 ADP-ribosylation/crystallin J1 [Acinetobacter sp. C26M]USA49508.1 ADP-ribosylation/crystallin J1 [Acinetobacter sp. C26G]